MLRSRKLDAHVLFKIRDIVGQVSQQEHDSGVELALAFQVWTRPIIFCSITDLLAAQ